MIRFQTKLFETTLEKLARVFSNKYNIKIVFKANMCCTTGSTIYLSSIPENSPKEFLDAIVGYADHEIAHIIYSDFGILKEIDKLGQKHHLLTNSIEDFFVEQKMISEWRGTKINLNNCREWSLKNLTEKWNELSEFGKLISAIYLQKTLKENHWFWEKHIESDSDLLKRLSMIKDLTDQIPQVESSKDSFELAKKIMERLGEEEEEKSNENKITKIKLSNEEDCLDVELENPVEILTDGEILSVSREISKSAKIINKIKQEDRPYLVYSTENDEIEEIYAGDKEETKQFIEKSRTIINTLEKKFRNNLLSETTTRWDPGKFRGKLNHRVLYKISQGTAKDVFRKKTVNPGFDTVCSFLIDHSGSMAGNQLKTAALTSLIFGENLYALKIPFEILGYSTVDFSGEDYFRSASLEDQTVYTRWGRLWIGVYKKFDELWPSVRHRCVSMRHRVKHNTYDGESVKLAASRLLVRKEKRKILFVLCDGLPEPNCKQFEKIHRDYLKTICKKVESTIELIAIGIQCEQVSNYYSNYVVLNNIKELPNVMMSTLDNLLRKQGRNYSKAI